MIERNLSVLIVATDNEQRALLKALVTKVTLSVHACENFPVAGDDPAVRAWLASGGFVYSNPDVILVDIPSDNYRFTLRAIELLHQQVPESAIFAIGSRGDAYGLLAELAMSRGASEFIERPTTTEDLLEAFYRCHLTELYQKMEEIGRSLPWFFHG